MLFCGVGHTHTPTFLDDFLAHTSLLLGELHAFFGGAKAARALLVHFGPRSLVASSKVGSFGSSRKRCAPSESLTTPSMAMYKTLLGRTILNRRSMYSKMATIISSSFLGAGLCKHQNRHYEKKWTSGRSYGTTANAYCSFAIYTFKMNNFYEWQNYKWPPSLWILITKKQKKTWNDHLKPTHP